MFRGFASHVTAGAVQYAADEGVWTNLLDQKYLEMKHPFCFSNSFY